MIKIILTEGNLRDLVAGKIIAARSDFIQDIEITVRELPQCEILAAVLDGMRELLNDGLEE